MAKVTSKLQITLPKKLAEEHNIAPGDDIRFESAGGAIRIIHQQGIPTLLSREERLRLFNEASERTNARFQTLLISTQPGEGRDWTRDELYDRNPTN